MTLISWITGFLSSLFTDIFKAIMSETIDTPGESTTVINTGDITLPQTPVDQVLQRYEGVL